MRASWLVPSLVAVLASFGCASAPANPDDLGETGDDAAELRLASNSGFFVVSRHDNRRCVSPLCGGFFVRRVNAQSSRCGDGSYASECYVSELDLSAIGLTGQEADDFLAAAQDGKAALRGGFEGFDWNGQRLYKLAASEGWKAAGGTPVTQLVGSTGYRVTSTGIMCITSPCPTFKEATLNASSSRRIHDVDWGTKAPQELFTQALDALSTKDGVLVAGNNTSFTGPGGAGTRLVANEFYLKVTPSVAPPPTGQACGSRGHGPCPTGQYCDFPESAACGSWDAGGTCRIAPQICTKIYKPVCGCDGQTYGNDCMAHSASTSIKSQGECP